MSLTLRVLGEICRKRSVVLCYHGIDQCRRRDDLSMLLLAPDRFRRQVELLSQAGFQFLTLAELAHRAGGATPPPGLAAITFDDGFRNNHAIALPILAEREIRATVYVTIGFIGASSPWIGPGADGRMMEPAELRELVAAGWELGAHTMTHPDLSSLDYAACRREIAPSRSTLEEIAQTGVQTFAYPFGRYGPAAVQAARDVGFVAAATTGSGSWEPYEMTRAPVGALDPLPVLALKLTDNYEPLLRTPPLPLLRRASKRVRGSALARQRADPPQGQAAA